MPRRTLVAITAASLCLVTRPAASQDAGAAIRGRIVAADTGRPLRRASIIATPESGTERRSANSNADGRYEIKGLAEGRYTVSVARSGYLPLQYGQHRPLEQATLLRIAGTDTVDRVDFALPKMGLIAGRVTDERGDPIAGVRMTAMRWIYVNGARRLVAASGFRAQTDDAGRYRLTELVPGTYFVMARTREMWTTHVNGRAEQMGFYQTFFPGSSDVAVARQVAVGIGEQVAGIDFSLVPARTVKVSGTAVDSHGRPLAGRGVGLTRVVHSAALGGRGGGSNEDAGHGSVGADGSFTIDNVLPGDYKLQARGPSSRPGGEDEAAARTITVQDSDVRGVALKTSMGWSIAGRITTESGAAPMFAQDRARIVATVPDDTNPRGGPPGGKTRINDDWTFAVLDLFGPARLRVNLPDGWAVKAMRHDGRDVTDTALEPDAGSEDLANLEIVLTNRVTTVQGRVTDATGTPTGDATVILFAADSQKWEEDSRFVRAVRPDLQGTWQIKGLPEYLAVAVEYAQEGAWNDPEYLAGLRDAAQKLELADAGSRVIPLTVAAK